MFRQIMSYALVIMYTSNLLSAAFVGLLISSMSLQEVIAAPVSPVSMSASCPDDATLIGGKCIKQETQPITKSCASGYTRYGSSDSCYRDESSTSTPVCGTGYTYNSALFPELCYARMALTDMPTKTYYMQDGTPYEVHECNSTYPTEIGAYCYTTEEPEYWACPTDSPGAAPIVTDLTCTELSVSMGLCNGGSQYTTPDQRWSLNSATKMCSRTIWDSATSSCPIGYTMSGGECTRSTTTSAVRSCPAGYYQNNNQCFPGEAPSCPAGSTMRFGVCNAPDGTLSCPSGKYLEESSNLCVENRNDSQPATWTSEDFDALYEQGAELGSQIASSVTMPTLGGGGSINITPSFLNAKISTQDVSLYNAIAGTGVDANNGYDEPTGTYQNEDNQTEFVANQINSNRAFLDDQENVPGATSEEQVDNTDHSALAYGTLTAARNQNPPRKISRNSAMFQTSAAAVGDAFNGTGAYFSDCSAETVTYKELDESKIVTTNETCFKPNKNNLSGCIVDRILHKPTLSIIKGADNANLAICGEKCVRLTLGKEGDNYLKQVGSCGIYEEDITIALAKGNKLTKATMIGGSYDDHLRLSADNNVFFNGVHGTFNTADGFPTTATPCERSTSRTVGTMDVTPAFVAAFTDDQIQFKYKAGAGGYGEAYAFVELLFEEPVTSRWSEEFIYSPKGCNTKLDDQWSEELNVVSKAEETETVSWSEVNLSNWATEDTNGNWQVQSSLGDVMQVINGQPTSYLSEQEYELSSFKGYVTVKDTSDDDFIGFVFGVPSKGTDLSDPSNSFYLVSWKQGSQDTAEPGIVLAKVSGSMGSIPWTHQNSTTNYEVLATSLGTGWQANIKHEFQLAISATSFVLSIDGEREITYYGDFDKGRIGFYNYSQTNVLYSKVEQSSSFEVTSGGNEAEFEDTSNEPTFCTANEFICTDKVEWTPIYLGEWETEDDNGDWQIDNNPNDVVQKVNGNPTSYISELVYELNSFKGNITVQTNDDDDFIGFVFGVPEKGADLTDPANSFYLVSWKQGSQDGAQPGIVLAKVSGNMDTIPWDHQNSTADYEVLATSLGTGWQDKRKYEFQLDVRPDSFTLSIDGIEKLSTSGVFNKGRIGFYNSSQSNVLYSQVEQLYPSSMGRDAEYIFSPLWSNSSDVSEARQCMSGYREDYLCDPLKGKKLSIGGGSFSFKEIINMDDACSTLDRNDECDVISQECVEGWLDEASGTCYAWNVKYECQDTRNAMVTKTRTNDSCLTEMPCIDGTCDVRAEEENLDFTEALTTYATMNEMGNNQNCEVEGDPTTCRVFSGEARYCSWDQLKVNDCCEEPAGVEMIDVFSLGAKMYTVTGYMASAEGAFGGTGIQTGLEAAGEAVSGVWKDLKKPVTDAAKDAWKVVSKKFTGAAESVAGEASGTLVSETGTSLGNFYSSATTALSNFKNTLLQKVYDLLPDALQRAIQSAATALSGPATSASGELVNRTGAEALNSVGSQVMSVVSFIGWAYAVYQLANLAYTMLTACDDEEQDMGVMLISQKCFKTGHRDCTKVFGVCTNRARDYHCCYESVLSRIIMDQSVEQLGWSKENYRNNMQCRGLTIEELTRVDFSKIDFSEWLELMAQSDSLPVDKSMEDVTGGNISNGFGRDDTLERNNDRAPDNEWVDRRTEMEEGDIINNINCNQRPRPIACEQDAL